jgi:hypothetical protein
VKLTTHLHLVPRSKSEWRYTSTPNTPSRRGAQLKLVIGYGLDGLGSIPGRDKDSFRYCA